MVDATTLLCLAIGVAGLAVGPVLGARTSPRRDRLALAGAALHPLLSLGLFYSLAVHVYQRFGAWPRDIGQVGWPSDLVVHAEFAQAGFGSLLLGFILVLPMAAVLCASVPAMRPALRYLGCYALTSGLVFVAMELAPTAFLNWWWD